MAYLNYTNDMMSINSTDNISYEYIIDNIDNNVRMCNDNVDNETVNEALCVKNNILNMLNNYSDDLESCGDLNNEEVELEEEKDNMEKFEELYNEFIQEYKDCQSNYFECKNVYKKEIEKSKSNIKKIDLIIQFIKELDNDCNDQETEELLNSLKVLSKKIEGDKNILLAKNEYIKSRKKIEKSLNLVKKLNIINTSNKCPICLSNVVSIYLNPCGHTCCDDCYDKLKNNHDNKCFLCRSQILNKSTLFFS
jgi:hypothetical protein